MKKLFPYAMKIEKCLYLNEIYWKINTAGQSRKLFEWKYFLYCILILLHTFSITFFNQTDPDFGFHHVNINNKTKLYL